MGQVLLPSISLFLNIYLYSVPWNKMYIQFWKILFLPELYYGSNIIWFLASKEKELYKADNVHHIMNSVEVQRAKPYFFTAATFKCSNLLNNDQTSIRKGLEKGGLLGSWALTTGSPMSWPSRILSACHPLFCAPRKGLIQCYRSRHVQEPLCVF